MAIDKERLRELASDPANKIKDICNGLGIADPTLYQAMGRDPELKRIFQEARAAAKAARKSRRWRAKSFSSQTRKEVVEEVFQTRCPPPQRSCQNRRHQRRSAAEDSARV